MFIIVMLCNDDGKFYIDYVNLGKEFCIYDEDKELVTKYEIINIDN